MPSSKKRKGKQSDPRTWEEDDADEAQLVNQEQDNADLIASGSHCFACLLVCTY